MAELQEKLAELESSGALAHSTALFDGGLLDAHATEIDDEEAGGCPARYEKVQAQKSIRPSELLVPEVPASGSIR